MAFVGASSTNNLVRSPPPPGPMPSETHQTIPIKKALTNPGRLGMILFPNATATGVATFNAAPNAKSKVKTPVAGKWETNKNRYNKIIPKRLEIINTILAEYLSDKYPPGTIIQAPPTIRQKCPAPKAIQES